MLGVPDSFITWCQEQRKKNCTFGWEGLRGIFGRAWVRRDDFSFMTRFFDGKVACQRCVGEGVRGGVLSTKKNKLDEHERTPDHIAKYAAAAAGRSLVQSDLVMAGFAPSEMRGQQSKEARMHVVARLVAGAGGEGKSGGAGIPPTSIPALFNGDFLLVGRHVLARMAAA